ncbi:MULTISPECIES: hypothetical protein [unclassified Pseudomonas]|uniref:hypothetical protein n=1 Tax=unclassified Pseudomonas TaxID=196821 RepID=UPI001114309D|nr:MULTISPECIES: hypothetical protein [unclassified Pseudomonas]
MADIQALHAAALHQDLVEGIHLDAASGDDFASAGLIHKKSDALRHRIFIACPQRSSQQA